MRQSLQNERETEGEKDKTIGIGFEMNNKYFWEWDIKSVKWNLIMDMSFLSDMILLLILLLVFREFIISLGDKRIFVDDPLGVFSERMAYLDILWISKCIVNFINALMDLKV